jgi:hypothetical protein
MITEKYVALEELRETSTISAIFGGDDVRVEERVWRERGFLSVGKRRGRDPLWQYWIEERCDPREEHTMHRESASLYKVRG